MRFFWMLFIVVGLSVPLLALPESSVPPKALPVGFDFDFFGLLEKTVSVSCYYPLGHKDVVVGSLKFWRLSNTTTEVNTQGLGFGYRRYFSKLYSGYYGGFGFDSGKIYAMHLNNSDIGTLFVPYLEGGYQFEFANRSFVAIDIHAAYLIAHLGDVNLPQLGLNFYPRVSFGFHF